ncbi:hypothetical protein VTI74DRAFT_10892 [Chaetomium olivicolor]
MIPATSSTAVVIPLQIAFGRPQKTALETSQIPFHTSFSLMFLKKSNTAATAVCNTATTRRNTSPTALPTSFKLSRIHTQTIFIASGILLITFQVHFTNLSAALGTSLATSHTALGTFFNPSQTALPALCTRPGNSLACLLAHPPNLCLFSQHHFPVFHSGLTTK